MAKSGQQNSNPNQNDTATQVAELQKRLSALESENKSLREGFETAQAEMAEKQARADKIINEHEAKRLVEKKLVCRNVDPEAILKRAQTIWSDTGLEYNPIPEKVETHSYRVTTKPLGTATALPSAVLSNCLDATDAQAAYFSQLNASPGNYATTVRKTDTKSHQLNGTAVA